MTRSKHCTSTLAAGWLRGLLMGALAATPLAGAARDAGAGDAVVSQRAAAIAPAIQIAGGCLRGELHGLRTDAAVELLATMLGARVRWIAPADASVVRARLTGLTLEQALARLLRHRSYLLIEGQHPEIHVLGRLDGGARDATDDPDAPAAPADESWREMARLRRVAEVDRIAHADADSADVAAELDAVVRSEDEPAVRLAAAERLVAMEAAQAAGALAWLSSDAHPTVRQRAEVLLAAVAAERVDDGSAGHQPF